MDKLKFFCCICMQNAESLFSLESVDCNNVTHIEKLNFCVAKETWRRQYQICDSCISQLDVAHNFIQCCLQSEKFRIDELDCLIKKSKNNVEDTGKDDGGIKFTCHDCNRSFGQKKYLSQHITKLHVNRKKIEKTLDKTKKDKREQKESKDVDLVKLELESDGVKSELETIAVENQIKEENEIRKVDRLANDENLIEKEQKPIKIDKMDFSDIDDFEDKTDLGNDIDSFDNLSAESEVDADSDKLDKQFGKKRGPKKEPQKCSFCDEVFGKRNEWVKHIRDKHAFQKPFSCDQCDASYMNGYSLLIHKRKHTNEKPFICATCGKSFVSSADLNHHNKTHDIDRAYPCPMCDRSFKTHSNLRTHRLQMHLDPADWKFLCNLCDKKFPIRGNLVKHLKRHAGIKEFNCHICEKRFVNKAELTLHLNTHTNQRLFKCKLCGRDYKNREGLRRHMKVVHDMGNWKAPSLEKKHMCPMCPKIFAFGNKLQRHLFTHTGEKPFKCDYCQKRFIDNYGRKVHYKKDHNMVDVF